jgi:hypothetical protein
MIRRRATPGTAWQGAACVHGSAAHATVRPDGLRGEEAALRRRVLRQVSDYVSVASGPDGAWVLLSMSVAGS